jgi:glucose/arabinose dehydrogenase
MKTLRLFIHSLGLSGMSMLFACGEIGASPPIDLSLIRLPPGFTISVFSTQVAGARSMALGDDGTVYVGSLGQGKVYALRDADKDGQAEQVSTIADELDAPNGVAWLNGDLYVAEVSRIGIIRDIGAHLASPSVPEAIYEGYPSDRHHGWKYLRVGPDGKLYTAVGAPCNVCKPEKDPYATLTRLDPDGQHFEIIARGLRNSVGFDWHPDNRELWLTDNGRDWLGDDVPPDELNHAPQLGLNFGFPHCFGKGITDPEFGKEAACARFTAPEWEFPAHVAALGIRFYTGDQFPGRYQKQLFVAQHGSWNRTSPQGYRVAMVRFENGRPVAEEAFAEGWLRPDGKVLGRPVDVLQMPDGSFLVSDDHAGAIYRISYQAFPTSPSSH